MRSAPLCILLAPLFALAWQIPAARAEVAPPAARAAALKPAAPFPLIDELRFGGAFFVDGRPEVREGEDDLFVTGELLFVSPFRARENPLLDALLRPRPHIGALVSTGGGTNQAYAGLTWHLPVWRGLFLEASFGGTVHDGLEAREPGENRPGLGCPLLFRESLAVGVEVGARWRATTFIDHSSHASLCDGRNDGLTHVGVSAGYKF